MCSDCFACRKDMYPIRKANSKVRQHAAFTASLTRETALERINELSPIFIEMIHRSADRVNIESALSITARKDYLCIGSDSKTD